MSAGNNEIMTEDQWLASTNYGQMLPLVRPQMSDRKLRLFGCACCRRIWHLLSDDANRHLIATVEDHPDGTFYYPDLWPAIEANARVAWEDNGYLAVKYLGRTYYKVSPVQCIAVAVLVATKVKQQGGDKMAEIGVQAALFRDVVGNPFRPVTIDPGWLHWNSGAVQRLARSIYDDRAFERLSILADALEAAGCTEAEILGHCRGLGPHARGCWVIDLLVGTK